MIVVLSDTHRTDGPKLADSLRERIRRADRVIHAGDFTTEAVLDGFQSLADRFDAVAGNRDSIAVSDRLPSARTLSIGGLTVALTHRQAGAGTGLTYFGQERGAELVISGHTHRPHFQEEAELSLLNPGSHADPRGGEPTYATLEPVDGGLRGMIHTPSGDEKQSFRVEGRSGTGNTGWGEG